MSILAEFPFDSNVIVVLVAVIFAAIKAFLERGNKADDGEGTIGEELLEQYEEELRRQQMEMEAREAAERQRPAASSPPSPPSPPSIPSIPETFSVPMTHREGGKPHRPKLTAAEKKALENFQRRSRSSEKRPSPGSTKSRVYRHLSSPTAAREALVLAEVLGPPKAFKESR